MTDTFFRPDRTTRDQFAKTPPKLYDYLSRTYGPFDFDPCPPGPEFDGLRVEWGQRNYVNPPFRDLKNWLRKAICEWKKGKLVVFLMPIRIHTEYFLDLVLPLIQAGRVEMVVIRGGVRFQDYKHRAPFGMMYLTFPLPGVRVENGLRSCLPD